jgi:hypothetical protein
MPLIIYPVASHWLDTGFFHLFVKEFSRSNFFTARPNIQRWNQKSAFIAYHEYLKRLRSIFRASIQRILNFPKLQYWEIPSSSISIGPLMDKNRTPRAAGHKNTKHASG